MATVPSISKLTTNDLAAIRDRIDSIGSRGIQELTAALPMREDASGTHIRKPLLILLSAVFTFGMLLGWLVIGWWLWPVEWTSFHPEQSSRDYQQMLVTWAANRYWQTGDATQVRNAFANWNREDLAKLLLTMQRGTTDTETRRRLVALTEALHLPVSETSLITFVFSQPIMVLSLLLSAAPLLAAFTLVTVPRIRKRAEVAEELLGTATQPEESLDELLTEVEAGDQTAMQGQEKKEEEKKEDQPSEEEAEGESSGLGDLASLFEEEDTSINVLEAFCKGMPDISIDELLTMSANIVHQLRQSNAAA